MGKVGDGIFMALHTAQTIPAPLQLATALVRTWATSSLEAVTVTKQLNVPENQASVWLGELVTRRASELGSHHLSSF